MIRLDFSNVSTVALAGGGMASLIRLPPFSCIRLVCVCVCTCVCVCFGDRKSYIFDLSICVCVRTPSVCGRVVGVMVRNLRPLLVAPQSSVTNHSMKLSVSTSLNYCSKLTPLFVIQFTLLEFY